MTGRRRILLLGRQPAISGAALIHWKLAEHLGEHLPQHEVLAVPEHPVPPGSVLTRLRLASPAHADVTVFTAAPLPLSTRGVLIRVVYEAPSLRPNSLLTRSYRVSEFLLSVRRASELFTISETSAAQLQLAARMRKPVTVLPMGPGQFEGYDTAPPQQTKTIFLIGRLPHKRNEVAATLLATSPEVRNNYRVIAVAVSPETITTLRQAFGADQLEVHQAPSTAELSILLGRASVYVALGLHEGYGLPYIEAAYFGCDVIVPNLVVTREVLGRSGNYLRSQWPSVADLEAALAQWEFCRVSALQEAARARSWRQTAAVAASRIQAYLA